MFKRESHWTNNRKFCIWERVTFRTGQCNKSDKWKREITCKKKTRRRHSSECVTGPILTENSASNPEQNLHCGDSLLSEAHDSLLFIPAVCKKDNGDRMYNKKQYCLYCKEGFIKMARHLERAHMNEAEVARAFSFPKNSKERRLQLERLRNGEFFTQCRSTKFRCWKSCGTAAAQSFCSSWGLFALFILSGPFHEECSFKLLNYVSLVPYGHADSYWRCLVVTQHSLNNPQLALFAVFAVFSLNYLMCLIIQPDTNNKL